MVNTSDTQTVIATVQHEWQDQPSFKRWLKHSFYFKNAKHFFSEQQSDQIAKAIEAAEQGHRGEIQVIVEASLPSHLAFDTDTYTRARQLFAEHRVWDTERNSGILIYLNICARKVELVADRGINRAVEPECWHKICGSMIPHFQQQHFTEGLVLAVSQIGEILQGFYQFDDDDKDGNELSNRPKFI